MSVSKDNEIHKRLGTGYTKIKQITTGQEASVNGRSLITLGAMRKIVLMSKSTGKPVDTSGCITTQGLYMVFAAVYHDQVRKETIHDTELSGLYDPVEIESKINKIITPLAISLLKNKTPGSDPTQDEINAEISNIYVNFKYLDTVGPGAVALKYSIVQERFLQNNISQLTAEYRRCPGDQFFFIPLSLISLAPVSAKIPNHANGIFISKAKGTVFRVEPQQLEGLTSEEDAQINKRIVEIVEKIGLKSPTVITIKTACPQAVVLDKNCIFWTTLIFEEIIKNLYKKDINTTIQEISSKPASELHKLIYNYKKELFSKWIPVVLKEIGVEWSELESNKLKILEEIEMEYAKSQTGSPMGGKTRRVRKLRKTKRSKNRLARR